MNLAKSFRSRLCQILPSLFISLLLLSCGGATAANDERLERAAQQLRNRQYEEALQSSLQAPASGRRSLMTGISLVRLNRPAEALPYLQEAERTYPLLADHAAALRAQGLFALKQYRAAAEVATKAARSSRAAALSRQMEKLAADALFEAGELTAALAAYQQFSARHSLGNDSVDARYRAALCREQLGEQAAALDEYRAVWLQHPSAPQAERAQQALKRLNQENTFRPEELYQRATLLLAAGRANDAAWALAAIPRNELSDDLLTKVELKSGQAASKQRNYTLAKQFLARATLSRTPSIRDEARLALARVEERINESEQALARLLSLASERGPLADDALLEAGFVHKHAGSFSESNLLFERLARDFQTSELAGRASWEAAWSHYLAGELPAAA
ncbi:MAG: tol-pal system YbgF family protein, partial [Geobacter sp.]